MIKIDDCKRAFKIGKQLVDRIKVQNIAEEIDLIRGLVLPANAPCFKMKSKNMIVSFYSILILFLVISISQVLKVKAIEFH